MATQWGVLLGACLLLLNPSLVTTQERCHRDIMFVLDATPEAGNAAFTNMIESLREFISNTYQSYTDTRIGFATYGGSPGEVTPPQQSSNNALFFLDRTAVIPGIRLTHLGIATATQALLQSQQGLNSPSMVMVLISFGPSVDEVASRSAINNAKFNGIEVYTFGVYGQSDSVQRSILEQEMVQLATNPSHALVFEDSTLLSGNLNSLLNRLCFTGCRGGFIAELVCDASESIGVVNFNLVKGALKTFIRQTLLNNTENRIGVVVFSDDITEVIDLSNNIFALERAVDQIHYTASGTRTDLGIKRGREILLAYSSTLPKVMITITDGLSNAPELTAREAEVTKSRGITSFVVGVTEAYANIPLLGERYNAEMLAIATDNFNDGRRPITFIPLQTFGRLEIQANDVIAAVCQTLVLAMNQLQPIVTFVNTPFVVFSTRLNRELVLGLTWTVTQGSTTSTISDGFKYQIGAIGFNHTLTIQNVQFADAGMYNAMVQSQVGGAPLVVLGRLQDVNTQTGIQARFELRMTTYGGYTGSWYRNGQRLQNDPFYIIQRDGEFQRLIIRNVQVSDGGQYTFRVDGTDVETTANLILSSVRVDGGYTVWTLWADLSTCDATCGRDQEKTVFRSRSCTNPEPQNGGAECVGLAREETRRSCNIQIECPVDGQWMLWSNWAESFCPVTCGYSTQARETRVRECVPPRHNGSNCPGDKEEQRRSVCFRGNCPVNGGWTDWTPWSSTICQETCGSQVPGTQNRLRFCRNPVPRDGGADCQGNDRDSRPGFCNDLPQCPAVGVWLQWSQWTEWCSRPCGANVPGTRFRSRTCSVPNRCSDGRSQENEQIFCNDPCSVDGGFGIWSNWEEVSCSRSCGDPTVLGTQMRQRACNNPLPDFGGRNCTGDFDEFRQWPCVDIMPCPIDGRWSSWTQWVRSCRDECGVQVQGSESRERSCSRPEPQFGGRLCLGESIDVRPYDCEITPCDVNGDWSEWSQYFREECSVSCDRGQLFRTRNRTCTNPAPEGNGLFCPGSDTERTSESCFIRPCPVPGGWSVWSEFEFPCKQSCGSNIFRDVRRERRCDSPFPQNGGAPCDGQSFEIVERRCDPVPCPVPGGWGSWVDSELICDQTCGPNVFGVVRRVRECNRPPPSNNGADCVGDDQINERRRCPVVLCPVPGNWGVWVETPLSCDRTCGVARRKVDRRRECNNPPPQNNGPTCPGVSYEQVDRDCPIIPCPVDGQYGPWVETRGPCSVTCGEGTLEITRRRECDSPPPSNNGADCVGPSTDSRQEVCRLEYCRVPGVYGPWGAWDEPIGCDIRTCGNFTGYSIRLRNCTWDLSEPFTVQGDFCRGISYENDFNFPCGLPECPTHGNWGEWGSWILFEPCDRTCGGGQRRYQRTRQCDSPPPDPLGNQCAGLDTERKPELCNPESCSVDGNWADWTPWFDGICSVSCGEGFMNVTRSRTCTNPRPRNRGLPCQGPSEGVERRSCTMNLCPVDYVWTNWEEWSTPSQCSSYSCGLDITGTSYRVRRCIFNDTSGAPQGRYCDGPSFDEDSNFPCIDLERCPTHGAWSQWTQWSQPPPCPVTCGGGQISLTRTRQCNNPAPSPDGRRCVPFPGEAETLDRRFETCNPQSCAVDGKWTIWTDWRQISPCNATCDAAYETYRRQRFCSNPAPSNGGRDCFGNSIENRYDGCFIRPCPVDGSWSEWGIWSLRNPCNVTCGRGYLTGVRYRRCDSPSPSNGGRDCFGDSEMLRFTPCNDVECPVDGGWSPWSPYIEDLCSVTCGPGTKRATRRRSCSNPFPRNQGRPCQGPESEFEMRDCEMSKCPVNGTWADWGSWFIPFVCNRTCGENLGGFSYRFRECVFTSTPRGAYCPGDSLQTVTYRDCNLPVCPRDGNWGPWSELSIPPPCPVTCGGGRVPRTRERACDNPPPNSIGQPCQPDPVTGLTTSETILEDCNTQSCAVDGKWTIWDEWQQIQSCTRSCGRGEMRYTRRRYCSDPPPSNNGLDCQGSDRATKTELCNPQPCPEDGQWSRWQEWSPIGQCNVTCGAGYSPYIRRRTCSNPPPSNGGIFCVGSDSANKEDPCSPRRCPVDGGWSDWTPWINQSCSVSCGPGVRNVTRSRICSNPFPRDGGRDCFGTDSDRTLAFCQNQFCPVDYFWSPWSEWSEPDICSSLTCGLDIRGFSIRNRSCEWNGPVGAPRGIYCNGSTIDVMNERRCSNLDVCPTHGAWSLWTQWSQPPPCPVTCGGAEITTIRTRLCNNPPPSPDGRQCVPLPGEAETLDMKKETCNPQTCAVDGQWTQWLDWALLSPCNVTCNTGYEQYRRERFCTNPPPSNSGRHCPGDNIEIRFDECVRQPCPIDGVWSGWTDWSQRAPCNVSCGEGSETYSRSRSCSNPPPNFGGRDCPEDSRQDQFRRCNTRPCPIHGQWSNWREWQEILPCDVTCGEGVIRYHQYRICDDPIPEFGGNTCNGISSQSKNETCNPRPCPVNGNWARWSEWTQEPCSTTCGPGVRNLTRLRTCSDPFPRNGGSDCDGSNRSVRIEDCRNQLCPVDYEWAPWTEWDEPAICTVLTCGLDVRGPATRTRVCEWNGPPGAPRGAQCRGPSTDVDASKACSNHRVCPTHGAWSQWTQWSQPPPCPVTCGGAQITRIRTRECNNPAPSPDGRPCVPLPGEPERFDQRNETCNPQQCEVHGNWANWLPWRQTTSCNASCGGGYELFERNRFCSNPPPSNGGRQCVGEGTEGRADRCNPDPCPIHGNWANWGQFNDPPCDVTCGTEATKLVTRTRTCTNPEPRFQGRTCFGTGTDVRNVSCNLTGCPVDGSWTVWSVWQEGPQCTLVSCGSTQTKEWFRERFCSDPPPVFGGQDCGNSGRESYRINCGLPHCPGDVEGICKDTENVGGVGYRYHPEDCHRYIQCYYNTTDDVVAVHRSCPFGYYWNQESKRCEHSWNVDCPLEKCRGDCAPTYDFEGSCSAYWMCENGRSVAQCCPPLHRYVPSKGCMPDPTCRDECPSPCLYTKDACDKRPEWNLATSYRIRAGSLGWVRSACPPNNIFDIARCECVQDFFFGCNAFTSLNFDGTDRNDWQLQNVNVGSAQGIFIGNSRASTDLNLRQDLPGRPLVLRFRYRELQPIRERVMLARARDCVNCQNASNFMITLEPNMLVVQLRTWMGAVVRIPVSTEGFQIFSPKDVTVFYQDNMMMVIVKSGGYEYINSEWAPQVELFQCGIEFGMDKDDTAAFSGEIDYIRYYKCHPGRLY